MDQLINKVPEVRLSGSYAALKGNAWFDELDWVNLFFIYQWLFQEKLVDYELKPPFVPPEKFVINQTEINRLIEKSVSVTEKI